MKTGWILIFGVLCGLLAAGLILLVSSPPRGVPVSLLPPPSPLPLGVHVGGSVAQPGLYSLPPGSRVQDALQAAGGLLPGADVQTLNLAAYVQDGQKLWVPPKAPTPLPLPPGVSQATPAAQPAVQISNGLVNINTASLAELDTLPGIGPVIAQRIIDYRTKNGPFAMIEDIQKVSGIGPVTYAKLKDLITV